MSNRGKVGAALVIVFLAGGAVGWVLTYRSFHQPAYSMQVRWENFRVRLMQRWLQANRLDLTPEQQEAIRPIVDEAAENLRRQQRENLHNARQIIEQLQDRVAARLTPEQRKTFNELIAEQRQRMKAYFQERKALREQRRGGQRAEPGP